MDHPTAPVYDYQEIVKLLSRRNAESEKQENKKNVLHGKQWMALKNYSEAIEKFERVENFNSTVKNIIADKAKLRANIDQEHKFLTKQLEDLQQTYDEIKTKSKSKSKAFFEKTEELCEEFIKMPLEFDNENIHQMIKESTKSISFYNEEYIRAMEEMQKVKDDIHNFDKYQEDLSSLEEVTKIIQKESLEKYGDPMELQIRLSELSRNNEKLVQEIQDMKVKYGI